MPQVLLPAWADCYDWGSRVEYLGVGRWGSKTQAPGWSAEELGGTLCNVLFGEKASDIQAKAEALSRLSKSAQPGRDVAARTLHSLVK